MANENVRATLDRRKFGLFMGVYREMFPEGMEKELGKKKGVKKNVE